MYLQRMKHATPMRRYWLGNFVGTLLSHCVAVDEQTEYAHALVIYQLLRSSQTAKPALVISAARTPQNFDGEYALLSSITDKESTQHGASPAWADSDKFEAAALKLAGQLLNIEEEPIIIMERQTL